MIVATAPYHSEEVVRNLGFATRIGSRATQHWLYLAASSFDIKVLPSLGEVAASGVQTIGQLGPAKTCASPALFLRGTPMGLYQAALW